MRFKNFMDVKKTSQQAYFKDAELMYPDQNTVLQLAILPAYDLGSPEPTGWVPAVDGNEENDFYCTVRAAKFVGHGNRRAKISFLSPRTFDLEADDPYEAFYEYCCSSDKWSYLTKDRRGKRLTGEVEGAIFPRMKNFFVANVMDARRPREGVYVTELSESVAKAILYSIRKNGSRVNGIAFQRDEEGKLAFGDITDPRSALVLEIAWSGKGYVARPAVDSKGKIMRVEIPTPLLQHRKHMEEPGSFLVRPGSGQDIVNRIADLLRGYKSESGEDEIHALQEAMQEAYGGKYTVPDEADETAEPEGHADPFADAAEKVVNSEHKAEAVDDAVERAVEHEHYTPVNKPEEQEDEEEPLEAPGEEIDSSDIAAVRAMLSGGKE